MCGFTCVTYAECAHTVLSTKSKYTCLCSRAKLIHLVQGIDCAPADCIPTNDTETRIAANHAIFDLCDDCHATARAAKPIERGEMDDIVQAHAHAKEEGQGFYDEDETAQMQNLATYLDEKHAIGREVVGQLRTLTSDSSALALVTDPELRVLLSAEDVEKHFTTFQHCSEFFPLMDSYIQQCASNKLFVETFVFVREKAKRATALLECFQIVVDCLLNHEASRPEEHFQYFIFSVHNTYRGRITRCFLSDGIAVGGYTSSTTFVCSFKESVIVVVALCITRGGLDIIVSTALCFSSTAANTTAALHADACYVMG